MILEEQFPVPRYTAASKIDNSVISLLWQLWCHCNPNHNNFSSLSDTTVVAIFPTLCLWRFSLCSNLEGIDPEKLYRATLRTEFTCPKAKSTSPGLSDTTFFARWLELLSFTLFKLPKRILFFTCPTGKWCFCKIQITEELWNQFCLTKSFWG